MIGRMLEDIPKKKRVIKAFLPKSFSDHLRSRAKDVGDGYIVSIVRPTTDHSTQILVTLPEQYKHEFVLLGNQGPILVDSEDAYNRAKKSDLSLHLTEKDVTLITDFVNRCIDRPLLNSDKNR